MTTSETTGWTIEHTFGGPHRIVGPCGGLIATVTMADPSRDYRPVTSLIESAPALLEACKALVKWMDESGLSATSSGGHGPLKYKGTEYSVVTDARIAIAQAEPDLDQLRREHTAMIDGKPERDNHGNLIR